jgi:electron transport complex protein RnfB
MLSGLLVIGGLALLFGLMLGYAAVRFRVEGNPLIDEVDKILPQIQCGQCGYPGCKPYATALVEKDDAINKCPPGGEETMLALAELLHKDPQPLEETGESFETGLVAYIREDECIGCVRCIKACPVDAILGATKFMHTVIAHECTGCHLCVPECPVDCIDMIKPPESPQTWQWQKPQALEDIPVIEVAK